MPLELGIWRIENKLEPMTFDVMPTESRLESLLDANLGIAVPHLMVVGRQVRTPFDKVIDLLAIDIEGNLAVIELKKDKTYRDIVAQLLDYGSWVRTLGDEDVARIYQSYVVTWHPEWGTRSINEAFCQRFRVKTMPDELNGDHELIIVASALDPSTERIVTYLAEHHEVNINAVFFRFYRDGDHEYLARAWLREPSALAPAADRGDWNGEYYVSFGLEEVRNWEEAVKYGFISAGGGSWYTNTLAMLEPDARIWINIPGAGYVGVGKVTAGRVAVDDFMVETNDGREVPITQLPLAVAKSGKAADNPETAEYLVRVNWIKTVPVAEAIKERGFFGNQNTVARPTSAKWDHTVERLKVRLGVA